MSDYLDRINAIREIVSKSGKLDAENIKIRMCERLGVDPSDIKKATFYRNLAECVEKGWIKETKIKNKKYWLCAQSKIEIIGQSLIESAGGAIYVPQIENIKNYTGIFKGDKKIDKEQEIGLYFQISNQFLCLRIDRMSLPVKIHVSRKKDTSDLYREIQEAFSYRTISLQIPVSKLSSYKGRKSGHCLLEIGETGISVEDLGSTNKTFVATVDEATSEELVVHGISLGTKTTNSSWAASIEAKINLEQVSEYKDKNIRNKIINCSEDFRLLIS